ncbi:bifunctional helix-turn-helix transcriptional regulator/GNAT family N-acetyltransferase [Mesorhizobium koreense]|uniref:bifunctional helix-turn-helix transcriptional regulator/GNAT family N-acetyltransferase n=1 Tax=Mesorhizobium koreense TaxID=3074855 RepID=UPI00287BAFDA|nr:helix-turn-helix domain-containing GNAT family N-acetyltransferase [Mesorhizobium sp. WR6]
MDRNQVEQVRRFNRLVTRRIGALSDDYLSRGRPLGEARLIFEVGAAGGTDLGRLRSMLGLDSGYMSRLLRSLEAQEMVEVRRKVGDGRAREVIPTAKGRKEFAAYDSRSAKLAQSVLSPLNEAQRERLVAAMAEVERLIRASFVTIAEESPRSADGRWCREQYFAELAQRFDGGFDIATGDPSDSADLLPPSGSFVVARLEGEPVGCGGLKTLDAGTGEVKRVWTAASARGIGVAGRIMQWLEQRAREMGFSVVRLDTNRSLTEAQALYRKLGYREIGRYNDNPYASHFFEKLL